MQMSWTHQALSPRRTLTAVTGLAAGALIPPTAAPGTASTQGPALATATAFTNPVIWQDFADIDVIRVGDTYYASASTSPPIAPRNPPPTPQGEL